MKSLNEQTPATKNQITNNKPDIIKNSNVLQGYLANSFNGGQVKTIAWCPIMAGTKVSDYRIRANIRMITPKTPVYQKLKATLKCFFVPNSRVWDNAEEFLAQKGGSSTIKIEEIPNIGGKKLPIVPLMDGEDIIFVPVTDSQLFRDSWASSYLPRYQSQMVLNTIDEEGKFLTLPKYSVLPFRGFKAIYNDFIRNKEYEAELTEYKDDTVSEFEFQTIIPSNLAVTEEDWVTYAAGKYYIRGRRQNSYYTDYRTELLGEETEYPFDDNGQPLLNLTEWMKTVSQKRSEAENAQANDWDIIAKIRGSRKLTQGKVQLLGTKTIGLNYQTVTQDTYNVNNDFQKEFQVMGEQGAYCYTEIDTSMFQFQEFEEEGYLHVLIQISADTVFETGFERTSLNVGKYDIYRPDLETLKEDVLFEIEKCGTRLNNAEELKNVTGYKRKYNEYFKAPNCLTGDLMTAGWYIPNKGNSKTGNYHLIGNFETYTESKRTFQFFEQDDKETGRYEAKAIWKDYTDELINRNLAIMQDYTYLSPADAPTDGLYMILGDNQLFMLGMQTLVASLPMSENIRNNYTLWGEL